MAQKGKNTSQSLNQNPLSEPELIMVAKAGAGLRAQATGVASASGADLGDLQAALQEAGATARLLFGDSEERIMAAQAAMPQSGESREQLPDMSLFYRVEAPESALEGLCQKLAACASVEAAYVKPPAYPSAEVIERGSAGGAPEGLLAEQVLEEDEAINAMMPDTVEAPSQTPDFTALQLYLDAAPVGIDARYAWTQRGGRGFNVRIIDIEGGWNFAHEDLRQNQGGVIGTNSQDPGWNNHGTAVVGEIGGDVNAFGVTGICPDAHVRGVSIFGGLGTAGALRQAADLLRPADIILIELHRPGPNSTGVGQVGFIPIEWWPDDYAAIRYAVNRGVVVISAAGNGGENLDAAIYNNKPNGFPNDWLNPFNRAQRDSGSVLVGAGAPPPGTNNQNHGPDRSRLGFSNYGAVLDAQGWGREVVTTGYGDLQGGSNRDLHYTRQFSGTSSSAPIVVGAIGCVQGVLRAHGRIPLSPARARELLRRSGSPQTDAPGRPRSQRIGNRPNLRQLIPMALQTRDWVGVQFTGQVPANATRRWFTHSWPAHWHVTWQIVPTSPRPGGPQIASEVQIERASDSRITYWLTVRNLTNEVVNIEGRYAVHGW